MLLLCGIEPADAQLGGLCAAVQRLLEGGLGGKAAGGASSGEKLAPALRRAAVRLLHSMASAAEVLDQVRAHHSTPLAHHRTPRSPPHTARPLASWPRPPTRHLPPPLPPPPQNILVEFIVLRDLAPSLRPLLLRTPPSAAGTEGATGCPAAEEGMQEDVLRLVVTLAAYGGHEAKNGFRRQRGLSARA